MNKSMEKFHQFLNFISYKYKLKFDEISKDLEEFVKEERETIINSSIEDDYKTFLDKEEEELEKMFNNGYKRVYSKQLPNNVESEAVKSNIPATELPATAHVIGDDGQPIETRTLIDKSVYVPER